MRTSFFSSLSRVHRAIIVFCGAVIGAVTLMYILFLSQSHPHGNLQTESFQSTPTPVVQVLPPAPTPEPGFTILLMGKGGAGHDGGALTDTMLLVRIMDSTKKILMLSIPRDLWVKISFDGQDGMKGKINSANAVGGGALAKSVVTQVTGLLIDTYVTIDFSGFEQAIDSIGGVDITVSPAFTDDEYPVAGREDMDCTVVPSTTPPPSPVPTQTVLLLSY